MIVNVSTSRQKVEEGLFIPEGRLEHRPELSRQRSQHQPPHVSDSEYKFIGNTKDKSHYEEEVRKIQTEENVIGQTHFFNKSSK